MCLVSICFSFVCACLTHFQIWLLYRHSPTQMQKSKKEQKACRNCNNLKVTRFHVVSAKSPAQLIRCSSMPEVSHVSRTPCQLGMQPTPAPQKAHVEAGEPGSQGCLAPRDACLQMPWVQLPALLSAKACVLTAFCANTAGCQFLSCTSRNARLGQGGDLCNELNPNVPFSLHTPHQSLLNNNSTRKFLYMLNPNPNNSRRLQNSSLTHRWEIPGRLSSSIKQTDKIETLIEFLLNYFCF